LFFPLANMASSSIGDYVRKLPLALVAEILDAEREMRLAPAFQARLRALPSDDAWMDVVAEEQLQLAVSRFAQLDPRIAVATMQCGASVHPSLRDKSIHVKHNRACQSLVAEGAPYRNLALFDADRGAPVVFPGARLRPQRRCAQQATTRDSAASDTATPTRYSIAISGSLT
jgi:hypothetical protein